MNKNDIFGFHSCFYYFGAQHLALNMYNYIKDGINKNEKIYLCLSPKLYGKLMKWLSCDLKVYVKNVNINNMISSCTSLSLVQMREKFSRNIDKIIEEGYSGVRFIIQVDYIIINNSLEHFMYFNSNVLRIIDSMRVSFMSLYDFEDYLKHRYIIDDKVIMQSYKVHSHRLYKGQLQECSGICLSPLK